MATLDEITKEKKRVGEALARVDAQREKLVHQLSELEAAAAHPIEDEICLSAALVVMTKQRVAGWARDVRQS